MTPNQKSDKNLFLHIFPTLKFRVRKKKLFRVVSDDPLFFTNLWWPLAHFLTLSLSLSLSLSLCLSHTLSLILSLSTHTFSLSNHLKCTHILYLTLTLSISFSLYPSFSLCTFPSKSLSFCKWSFFLCLSHALSCPVSYYMPHLFLALSHYTVHLIFSLAVWVTVHVCVWVCVCVCLGDVLAWVYTN